MKFFLDTAEISEIKEFAPTGLVDGVTTNPSLIMKSGRDFREVIAEICAIVEGPVSAEVTALEAPQMIAEGKLLARIANNVTVKLPLTIEGLKACRALRGEGVIVRFAAASFEVRTAVRDFAWIADGARGFDVKVTNATGMRAAIGVRGPLTAALAAASGLTGEAPAGGGGAPRAAWRPAQVTLMRDASGDGLELWTGADDGIVVWDRLWKAGAGLGVAAVGAQALEALRVESAIPRAGVDWLPAQLARSGRDLRLPYDLGVGPDLTRRFNGASALAALLQEARLVLVHLSADEPLSCGPIAARNALVGKITSTCWSEARGAAFALAWLEPDAVKAGSKVTAGAVQAEILRGVFS